MAAPAVNSHVPPPRPAPVQRHLAGTKADPAKRSLVSAAGAQVNDLTRHVGTEILGLQLKDFNDQQLEDLALLIAERGVVFFRDQDLNPERLAAIGRRLGKTHDRVPGVSPDPRFPDVQEIRVDANSKRNPGNWHQDHSADDEPAAVTFSYYTDVPDAPGGDTLWASLYEAYDKLSPAFRALLDSLETLQEGAYYPHAVDYEPARGVGERRFLTTRNRQIHPLIRTHPLTGWRILYVNSAWAKQIRGFTKAESDLLLNFLNQHIANGVEFQVRYKLKKNTVALWDNRAVQHVATWDYFPDTRVLNRVVVRGEKPFFDRASKSRREALGIPITPSWKGDIANTIADIYATNRDRAFTDEQLYKHLKNKFEGGKEKL
ncbi:alpha-ketoglutarate-dependent taurine dioxygenase [Hyaloraphidium curvatum]|nr:alpha-ketoglutarate-dependent taurine dioxygenase [Hyaloraphidium curvatum]